MKLRGNLNECDNDKQNVVDTLLKQSNDNLKMRKDLREFKKVYKKLKTELKNEIKNNSVINLI